MGETTPVFTKVRHIEERLKKSEREKNEEERVRKGATKEERRILILRTSLEKKLKRKMYK